MLILNQQIIMYFLEDIARYNIPVLLLSYTDIRKSLNRIFAHVVTFEEVFGKSLDPCKIVISCSQGIISFDKNIIKEITHNPAVKLIRVYKFDVLVFNPIIKNLKATDI